MHRSVLTWFSMALVLLSAPLIGAAAVKHTKGTAIGPEPLRTYVVQKGDTLWTLSQKLDTSIPELVADNHLRDPDLLQIGQTLVYRRAMTINQAQSAVLQLTRTLASRNRSTLFSRQSKTRRTDRPVSRVLYCTLTAYTAGYESTGKRPGDPAYNMTATGSRPMEGLTVAVDPHVIPYGTRLYIPGIGFRVADDTGGAVVGNHVDVFFTNVGVARQFGVKRDIPVYILANWFSLPRI